MTTYHPPPFPRRPKYSTPFSELRYQFQLAYYRYEINTALYVMSPGEKFAYNIIVLSFFVLLFCAVYYYLPMSLHSSIRRMAWYVTGGSRIHVAGGQGVHTLQHTAEAVASLTDSGRVLMNSSSAFEH